MVTPAQNLAAYRVTGYEPGAGLVRRVLWYCVNACVFASWLVPVSAPKRVLLRAFGARIGPRVVLKPRVSIKHPWRLSIGAHSWIGEGVLIDNLVTVSIGANACLSQGAFILTGNHDYTSPSFTLRTGPVHVGDGAWIGARAVICPGVSVGCNTVITVGSILTRDAVADSVYTGHPATRIRARRTIV